MTLQELKIIKIKNRQSTPQIAEMAELVIDRVQKEAKEKSTPIDDSMITNAIKKILREYEKDIEIIGNHGGVIFEYTTKMAILSSWLPEMLNEDDTQKVLVDIINSFTDDRNKKMMGKVLTEVKKNSNIDVSLASKLLQNLLS